ncbi:two-pore potassium channel 1-like [Actinidia eriantha]|uniref:two-pore potassium channel 1-like n=1 Tax=Actinidia eriantha TaxID=165200 RepID=UPI002584F4E9|nr:two-pore potassium channel 1-like [Actinidia eriantha]XP_057461510.1 two-pore potassium channel 1-like [Actinidia eriantha]
MASDSAKQPLLSALLDPTPQTNKRDTPKRRRFRRCKSAPLAEYNPGQVNANVASLPHSQSILDRLHPSFKRVAVFLTVYLGVGTLCFYLVSPQINGNKTNGVLDAVYFCIVTMTTVGYGDLVPNSVPAKLLACAFVFTGMALIGLILSEAADYLVERQEILLVKALHISEKVGQMEIMDEIETNKARYKCFLVFVSLLVLVAVGTIFLMAVEKLDLVDAFYCVCSTVTTLGYGDKSFSTKAGRVFAIIWILMSTTCLAQFFLYIAELYTETRQRKLIDWVLTRKMTKEDLEAADLDNDRVVGAVEFVIYKLKEMGKINHEDISLVMEEFENLDVDQSGTLSASDIMLAQSSETVK